MPRDLRDSCIQMLEWADKSPEEFIEFGLSTVIWPDTHGTERIDAMWEDLKLRVFEGGAPVYIRCPDRQPDNAQWYLDMCSHVFPNAAVKMDTLDSPVAIELLADLTGLKPDVDLLNYRVSRVLSCTANPLLYACPWNMLWIPTLLHPSTLIRTQGDLPYAFSDALWAVQVPRYKHYIQDYNSIMIMSGARKRAAEWLGSWEPKLPVSQERAELFRAQARVDTSIFLVR